MNAFKFTNAVGQSRFGRFRVLVQLAEVGDDVTNTLLGSMATWTSHWIVVVTEMTCPRDLPSNRMPLSVKPGAHLAAAAERLPWMAELRHAKCNLTGPIR
jgi:hypothetical protein